MRDSRANRDVGKWSALPWPDMKGQGSISERPGAANVEELEHDDQRCNA
jgi:hypothetical protein